MGGSTVKVFISSACHDLVDLRAELFDDLRDLGVEPLFSDIKESDFQVSTDTATNSIENCLANVHAAAVVVVVLSQRYGPLLGDAYGNLSATHCEYNEAKENKKPIHFYVRSQLAGEWSGWKKNGRPDNYKTAWAKESDAIRLFRLIDDHQRLIAATGQSINNWFWHFNTSVDLRSDVRRRLAPQAFRASAEKLINSGDVPLIMSIGRAGLSCGGNFSTPQGRLAIEIDIANVGRNPAISPTAHLGFGGQHYEPKSSLPVLLPGAPNHRLYFEIPSLPLVKALEQSPHQAQITLAVKYQTQQGYEFDDRLSFLFQRAPDGRPHPSTAPPTFGKCIVGMRNLILDS